MRNFTYITVGKILSDLRDEGIIISRPTFYRIEKKLKFPSQEKSSGFWRVYSQEEANQTKDLIKQNYKISSLKSEKTSESLEYLEKLHELKIKGVITDKEFEYKKKQILGI